MPVYRVNYIIYKQDAKDLRIRGRVNNWQAAIVWNTVHDINTAKRVLQTMTRFHAIKNINLRHKETRQHKGDEVKSAKKFFNRSISSNTTNPQSWNLQAIFMVEMRKDYNKGRKSKETQD